MGPLPFLVIFSLIAVFYLNYKHPYAPSSTLLVNPPPNLKLLDFGYSEVIADSMWIRVIQNFDACGKNGIAEVYDFTKGVDLAAIPVCDFSWVYQMVNSISDLAPRFYNAYYYGGMNLSYFVNDVKGAARIYEKGLRQFPGDLRLLFSAAYHMLEQVKDEKKASVLLFQAAKAGAPSFFMGLAAKLFSKDGRNAYAQEQLEKYIQDLPEDDAFHERLDERLRLLKEEGAQLKAAKNKKNK